MDDTQKVNPEQGGPHASAYDPVVMSDASVYELALVGCTQEEIASLFKVTRETMLKHHQTAFDAGKTDMKRRPRKKLFKLINDLEIQVERSLTETGEFALDEAGNEVRKAFDTKLGKLYIDAIAQADKYIAKEVNLTVTTPKATELTEEQILAELAKHNLTPKKD